MVRPITTIIRMTAERHLKRSGKLSFKEEEESGKTTNSVNVILTQTSSY